MYVCLCVIMCVEVIGNLVQVSFFMYVCVSCMYVFVCVCHGMCAEVTGHLVNSLLIARGLKTKESGFKP